MNTFQSAYQEEEDRLNRTLAEIDAQLDRLKSVPVYTGNEYTEQVLEASREQQRSNLAKVSQEPYFGRLDFQANDEAERKALYIGKIGTDAEQAGDQPLVIDWRAPVASLFYSFTGGTEPASYEAPEGLIEGLVYLKRNVVIRKRILDRVADTYDRDGDGPAVSDEFLVYRLGENKDNKLRDIVSTIQEEQDRIIRAAKNTALIIQGVAGSGKTTVALHRLAFLLYRYQEQVKAEKMIIFAPNRMFLDYISDVLPELGVGDIRQSTFADWAADVLGLSLPEQDAGEVYSRWFEAPGGMPEITEETPGRYKGSVRFMRMVEQTVERLADRALPEGDFSPWDGAVLPRRTIVRWHDEEYKPYPPAKRKERVMARIHRWIEMELKKSPSAAALKERKKRAAQREKAYAGKWPKYEPLAVYKQLFAASPAAEGDQEIPKAVASETRAALKKGIVREEDLPALLYIHYLLNGSDDIGRFDHVVIDEAQDFSPFQVAVLDLYVKGHSFTILGDLSQGIHAYRGVHAWEEMSALFPAEETAYHALTRSYRSTMEIIEFANDILRSGVQASLLAVPVFRSGNPVRLLAYDDSAQAAVDGGPAGMSAADASQRLTALGRALDRLAGREYRTVAILTRTLREAEEVHAALSRADRHLNLIDGSMTAYQGGLSVLPVYLSKGLEFDAVILADADDSHYGGSVWDAKLLYVGCTRALHELWLMRGTGLPAGLAAASARCAGGWPEEE